MAGDVTVQPDALRSLAQQLVAQVGPLLDQADQKFTAADVQGSAFSPEGIELQVVYPGTYHFAMQDASSKRQLLTTIHDKLLATADEWDKAEQANTIDPPGIPC